MLVVAPSNNHPAENVHRPKVEKPPAVARWSSTVHLEGLGTGPDGAPDLPCVPRRALSPLGLSPLICEMRDGYWVPSEVPSRPQVCMMLGPEGNRVALCALCFPAAHPSLLGFAGLPEARTDTAMSELVPEPRPKPAVPMKPVSINSSLLGYIGIDTIIEQMRKKTMKTGFDFNIMVVGRVAAGSPRSRWPSCSFL